MSDEQDKSSWRYLAGQLKRSGIDGVAITEELGVPHILAGVILEGAGLRRIGFNSKPIVRPERTPNPRFTDEIVPLFGLNILNPWLLRDLIRSSDLSRHGQHRLSLLLRSMEVYRRYHEDSWWQAADDLSTLSPAERALHDLVSLTLLDNIDDPAAAYRNGVNLVARVLSSSTVNLDNRAEEVKRLVAERQPILSTVNDDEKPSWVTLKVPVLKSEYNEPDRFEHTEVPFNRNRIKLLKGQHIGLAIGGRPHSGKSTTTASLHVLNNNLVTDCVRAGVIDGGVITSTFCDLDLASPTAGFVVRGEAPDQEKREWTDDLAYIARGMLVDTIAKNTITIGDLPGGEPDDITRIIAQPARHSILVDRNYQRELKPWKDFFGQLSLPSIIAFLHTRINEPGRASGMRFFQSRSRGGKQDFMMGRVVDLNLKVKDDIIIKFLSHVLLLDFLPAAVVRRNERAKQIASTLKHESELN